VSARFPCPCAGCDRDTTARGATEWYIVHGEVWAAAGMPHRGYLCIGCLEQRLGRPLTGADFPPEVPVNWPSDGFDTPRLYALKAAATGLPWQGGLW
jgi:hypothetical protein